MNPNFMSDLKPNLIVELSEKLALSIIVYCEELEKLRKFNVANQLFRSGTSIGANVNEAQDCQSSADFIHKLKIAAKVARETAYWLRLCNNSNSYPTNEQILNEVNSVSRVLTKIISTVKNKMKNS